MTTSSTPVSGAKRAQVGVQRFGTFLSGMIMPNIAIVPSIATNPNGTRSTSRNKTTPIRPSGAVNTTSMTRWKLRNCNINTVKTTIRKRGIPALTEP